MDATMSFPECSANISPVTRQAIYELGIKWASDPARPRISPAALNAWGGLIEGWIAEPRLPLLVRKHRNNRGALIQGVGGRILVPTDNSPAQWAFAVAHSGICPKVHEINGLLERGELPIAMILKTEERSAATCKGVRGNCLGTSDAGWKLAHIEGVALGGRGGIESYPLAVIEDHFRRFMSPANMLVVPAEWSGLAEVEAFVKGYCSSLVRDTSGASAGGG